MNRSSLIHALQRNSIGSFAMISAASKLARLIHTPEMGRVADAIDRALVEITRDPTLCQPVALGRLESLEPPPCLTEAKSIPMHRNYPNREVSANDDPRSSFGS